MYKLWEALDKAREYKWVELSHELNNDSPYWSGIPEGNVELGTTVFEWGNPMLECTIQTFKFPGQLGTHIDFPGHFIKGASLSDEYGVQNAVFPLCVVDITDKVKEDIHYAATAEDIKAYEAKYGPIPDGAFVTLDTDASAEAEKAGDLACERYVLASGKLQIEALCNLDQVAPAGAVLIAAWPRIQNACGMPVRVYAITE